MIRQLIVFATALAVVSAAPVFLPRHESRKRIIAARQTIAQMAHSGFKPKDASFHANLGTVPVTSQTSSYQYLIAYGIGAGDTCSISESVVAAAYPLGYCVDFLGLASLTTVCDDTLGVYAVFYNGTVCQGNSIGWLPVYNISELNTCLPDDDFDDDDDDDYYYDDDDFDDDDDYDDDDYGVFNTEYVTCANSVDSSFDGAATITTYMDSMCESDDVELIEYIKDFECYTTEDGSASMRCHSDGKLVVKTYSDFNCENDGKLSVHATTDMCVVGDSTGDDDILQADDDDYYYGDDMSRSVEADDASSNDASATDDASANDTPSNDDTYYGNDMPVVDDTYYGNDMPVVDDASSNDAPATDDTTSGDDMPMDDASGDDTYYYDDYYGGFATCECSMCMHTDCAAFNESCWAFDGYPEYCMNSTQSAICTGIPCNPFDQNATADYCEIFCGEMSCEASSSICALSDDDYYYADDSGDDDKTYYYDDDADDSGDDDETYYYDDDADDFDDDYYYYYDDEYVSTGSYYATCNAAVSDDDYYYGDDYSANDDGAHPHAAVAWTVVASCVVLSLVGLLR